VKLMRFSTGKTVRHALGRQTDLRVVHPRLSSLSLATTSIRTRDFDDESDGDDDDDPQPDNEHWPRLRGFCSAAQTRKIS
jgi:hypothetical protein